MDAIKNLLTRNASSKLTMPMPSSEQMQIVYQAALRSPDHAWLRPSSFIEVSGKGLEKLSKIFEKYAKEKKFASVRLDTFSVNKRNLKFYESRGYQRLEGIYFPKQSEFPFYCYELIL